MAPIIASKTQTHDEQTPQRQTQTHNKQNLEAIQPNSSHHRTTHPP